MTTESSNKVKRKPRRPRADAWVPRDDVQEIFGRNPSGYCRWLTVIRNALRNPDPELGPGQVRVIDDGTADGDFMFFLALDGAGLVRFDGTSQIATIVNFNSYRGGPLAGAVQ